MRKTAIKDFGFANLCYVQGNHNYYLLESKQEEGIFYSKTFSQYFRTKPTERQIRKTLKQISKNTTIHH